MEKKKLSEIIITGTPQELVEIEPLLVMAGYDKPDEKYNDTSLIKKHIIGIKGYENAQLIYRTAIIIDTSESIRFKASEIHKILHYIETGEIKEYAEDKPKFLQYAGRQKRIGDNPYTLKDLMNSVVPATISTMRNPDGSFTKTGQTKVVGNRTSTHPVVPNYTSVKDMLKKSKLRNWNKVEKAFKRWTNGVNGSGFGYSEGRVNEILKFFKHHFTK